MKKTSISRSQEAPPAGTESFFVPAAVISSWKLAKVPLCLLIGCSAVFGALLPENVTGANVLKVGLGVFCLALGAATLNSLQEVEADSRMTRTAFRPLVTKSVGSTFAIVQTCIFILLGLGFLLFLSDPVIPVILGIISVLLYNGFYTHLKKKTTFAIFPGALCGAAPPLIGWVAGGGDLVSFQAILIVTVLFLWQVPHFFLVVLRHSEDYLYTEQPSFLKLFSEKGIRLLSCAWIYALALVMMLFAVSTGEGYLIYKFMIVANAIIFALLASYELMLLTEPAYGRVFVYLNSMLCLHMFLVVMLVFSP